jgi:iduronate 2-sulfatase
VYSSDAPNGLKASDEYTYYHPGDFKDGTPEWHRLLRHGYYASVSYSDKLIGDILAELDRLGLAKNTIVVLWGDHGWHLGEHGFWGKHNTLHQAIRVPLLIRLPGKMQGQSSASLASLMDLFPTLCELAGLNAPASVQGRSLAPLFAQPTLVLQDAVYTRYGEGDAVVTKNYIYTSYGADGEMLYDLAADPGEKINVVGQPAYRETRDRMLEQLKAFQAKAEVVTVAKPAPQPAKN